MKNTIVSFLVPIIFVLCGCNNSVNVNVKDHKNMTSSEIIEVLENADIKRISTSHSQYIEIRLNDGTKFSGKYNPNEAPSKYQAPQLRDILNLSLHIEKARMKKWLILAE